MRLDRLKKRRQELKFTQEDCANAIGVEKGTYYRYEKGELPLPAPALEILSKKLEVSADWVLGLVDDMESHLTEEGLSSDERQLLNAARNGTLAEIMEAALEFAKGKDQSKISGVQPAVNS